MQMKCALRIQNIASFTNHLRWMSSWKSIQQAKREKTHSKSTKNSAAKVLIVCKSVSLCQKKDDKKKDFHCIKCIVLCLSSSDWNRKWSMKKVNEVSSLKSVWFRSIIFVVVFVFFLNPRHHPSAYGQYYFRFSLLLVGKPHVTWKLVWILL